MIFKFTGLLRTVVIVCLLVFVPVHSVLAQPAGKKIGFGVQVSTDGFFSTTIAKVAVTQVSPDSQALVAGVSAGDELVKIQDVKVPGNSAANLKEHMEFVPGVAKKITFKRANGTEFDVVFTRMVEAKP
jgi:C-terminal processing protease CtpA/Prc